MKIATWNVNSINIRMEQYAALAREHQTDVLCLQETKTIDENFPIAALTKSAYDAAFMGQKSYNGVAIVSKLSRSRTCRKISSMMMTKRRNV